MYGHSLIEDMEINKKFFIDDSLIEKIKASIHFYFGQSHSLYDLFKLSPCQMMFDGVLSASQIPYSKCVFFYDDEEFDRIGVQLEKQDDGSLRFFTYIIHPTVGWVNPGWGGVITNPFNDEESNCYTVGADEITHLYEKKNKELIGRQTKRISSLINVSIALLNTKNIATQEHFPPVKLNKKRIKKGKHPLFTYHTLLLQLPGKQNKSNHPHGQGDNTTRLHLCRGHFKTYTEKSPLLGKFTGRYWWQPQARGNKEAGIIKKDYAVKIAS